MKTYFSFCHNYYKLQRKCFTTIRGGSAVTQYKTGQEVDIITAAALPSNGSGSVLCRARIVMIEKVKLSSLSLEFLKSDGEFLGFTIYSVWDFIGLLNSFRKYDKSKIQNAEAMVTVFYLEKI